MNPSLDVSEVFLKPEEAETALKAGKTIVLIDEDGKAFARVIPEIPAKGEPSESTAKKKLVHGKK